MVIGALQLRKSNSWAKSSFICRHTAAATTWREPYGAACALPNASPRSMSRGGAKRRPRHHEAGFRKQGTRCLVGPWMPSRLWSKSRRLARGRPRLARRSSRLDRFPCPPRPRPHADRPSLPFRTPRTSQAPTLATLIQACPCQAIYAGLKVVRIRLHQGDGCLWTTSGSVKLDKMLRETHPLQHEEHRGSIEYTYQLNHAGSGSLPLHMLPRTTLAARVRSSLLISSMYHGTRVSPSSTWAPPYPRAIE